jgi:hypothetical protein
VLGEENGRGEVMWETKFYMEDWCVEPPEGVLVPEMKRGKRFEYTPEEPESPDPPSEEGEPEDPDPPLEEGEQGGVDPKERGKYLEAMEEWEGTKGTWWVTGTYFELTGEGKLIQHVELARARPKTMMDEVALWKRERKRERRTRRMGR